MDALCTWGKCTPLRIGSTQPCLEQPLTSLGFVSYYSEMCTRKSNLTFASFQTANVNLEMPGIKRSTSLKLIPIIMVGFPRTFQPILRQFFTEIRAAQVRLVDRPYFVHKICTVRDARITSLSSIVFRERLSTLCMESLLQTLPQPPNSIMMPCVGGDKPAWAKMLPS